MKRCVSALLLLAVFCLSGCSLLDREYSSVTPHSASYYESEDRSVLRAESYQDVVNDLLLLIGSQEAAGTISLYPGNEVLDPDQTAQKACQEVKQETPMGAYAVDYITYRIDTSSRNCNKIHLTIAYRRTAEQINAIVHTTDVAALYDLLTAAVRSGAKELVIHVGSFDRQEMQVQQTVDQVRREQAVPDSTVWQINYYPNSENPGIVELLLQP